MPLTYIADAVDNVTDVTAALLNALRDRAMNVFQDDAARVVSVPAPEAGRPFYYRAASVLEGLWLANTAGKVTPPWNLSWPSWGSGIVTVNQTGIGTSSTDLTGVTTGAVTYPANRIILVTAQAQLQQQTGAGTPRLQITDGSNVVMNEGRSLANGAGAYWHAKVSYLLLGTSAGSVTYKARALTNGNTVDLVASATNPAFIVVQDLGPYGAPA